MQGRQQVARGRCCPMQSNCHTLEPALNGRTHTQQEPHWLMQQDKERAKPAQILGVGCRRANRCGCRRTTRSAAHPSPRCGRRRTRPLQRVQLQVNLLRNHFRTFKNGLVKRVRARRHTDRVGCSWMARGNPANEEGTAATKGQFFNTDTQNYQ